MVIKYIESSQNQYLKDYRKLKDKKWREKLKLMPVEGTTLFREAVLRGVNISYAVIARSFWESGESPVISAVLDLEVPCFIVNDKVFDKVAFTETPQGILACVELIEYSLEDILERKKDILLSVGIKDPGNLGTLMRTAEAFDLGGVILLKGSVDPTNDKVIRSSMGAVFSLPFFKVPGDKSEKDIVDVVAGWGYNLIAAHHKGELNSYHLEVDESPVCIIIGTESGGIPGEIFNSGVSVLKTKIPISSNIESLNAAVAGSILVYEVFRSRLHKGL